MKHTRGTFRSDLLRRYGAALAGALVMASGLTMPSAAEELEIIEVMAVDSVVSDKMLTEVSASSLPQIVTTHRYLGGWNDAYEMQLAWASWENVELQNAEAYSALDQALRSWAQAVDQAAEQQYDAAVSLALEDLAGGMDAEYFSAGYSTSEARIRRADSQLLSFVMVNEYFNRGPHGYVWYQANNLWADTGVRITLDDLVVDKAGLKAVLRSELQEKYPDLTAFQAETDYDYWGDILPDSLVWTAEADTVTFWFAAGSLGSYAEGEQIISITYSDYPDLFKADFVTVPEAAVCEIAGSEEIYLDVNGDGSLDSVQVQPYWGEYGNIETIAVTVNDTLLTQDVYGYSLKSVVLKQDADAYLLTELTMDNDYRQNLIFRLSGGEPEYVTTADFGMLGWYDEKEQRSYTEHITNLTDFRWEARTDMLGTTSVFGRFYLDDNGMPQCRHEDLYYVYDRILTARQTLTGDEVQIDGDTAVLTGNTAGIDAGERVKLIGTDNVSYVDLQGEDGLCLRIPVDMSGYPATSNGVDVEELFAGILYAG